jgi:hypothetical protein
LQTVFLGWPWTMILPISPSQVAKITGVSYQYPADFWFLTQYLAVLLNSLIISSTLFLQILWDFYADNFVFFFLVVLGFELRASLLLGRHSTLEPLCQPLFTLCIFKIGSWELFARAGVNLSLPDLCLLSG